MDKNNLYPERTCGEIALNMKWIIWKKTRQILLGWTTMRFSKTYYRIPHTTNTFIKKVYEVECKSLSLNDIIEVLNFVMVNVIKQTLTFPPTKWLNQRNPRTRGYILINTLEGAGKIVPYRNFDPRVKVNIIQLNESILIRYTKYWIMSIDKPDRYTIFVKRRFLRACNAMEVMVLNKRPAWCWFC